MPEPSNPLVDIAINAGLAAIRRILYSQVAAEISDRMAAEGRRLPNAEEQARIDAIVSAADQHLDAAIEKAEQEGR